MWNGLLQYTEGSTRLSCSFQTLDTETFTRISMSTSVILQGRRSWGTKIVLVHTYLPWVRRTANLVTVSQIPSWLAFSRCHHSLKVKVTVSRLKVIWFQKHASAHPTPTGNMHTEFRDSISNIPWTHQVPHDLWTLGQTHGWMQALEISVLKI